MKRGIAWWSILDSTKLLILTQHSTRDFSHSATEWKVLYLEEERLVARCRTLNHVQVVQFKPKPVHSSNTHWILKRISKTILSRISIVKSSIVSSKARILSWWPKLWHQKKNQNRMLKRVFKNKRQLLKRKRDSSRRMEVIWVLMTMREGRGERNIRKTLKMQMRRLRKSPKLLGHTNKGFHQNQACSWTTLFRFRGMS